MPGKLLLLTGLSGSGKTTVAKELYKKYGLSQIYSYTTRPKRGEEDIEHIFISDEEFDTNTSIVYTKVAYTEYDNYRYCATAEQVEENDIFVIDAAGIEYFEDHYTGDKHIIVIYLDATEEDRYARMVERDGKENATRRLLYDRKLPDERKIADYVIMNNDLEQTVQTIYNIWKINPLC